MKCSHYITRMSIYVTDVGKQDMKIMFTQIYASSICTLELVLNALLDYIGDGT